MVYIPEGTPESGDVSLQSQTPVQLTRLNVVTNIPPPRVPAPVTGQNESALLARLITTLLLRPGCSRALLSGRGRVPFVLLGTKQVYACPCVTLDVVMHPWSMDETNQSVANPI